MARADKKFKAIRGILSLLSTDSTIRSYVEDKIYALIAPQDVEGDFIIIRRDGYRRQDTKMGVSLQASVFYVFVISDDYDRSLDIADKVYDVLDGDHRQHDFRIRMEDYAEEYIDQKFLQSLKFILE
ncbi:MAG: DUF3168 domain-containing protein [Alistipes sp.]|nr:DUF3168 domain-containing protein [Alistipes sp.]